MATQSIVTLTDANYEVEVLSSDVPVLVDFWAAWCGPCRMIAPIMEQLAGEYSGKVKVAKLNVDEFPGIPADYGIMSIPTLIIFKNGQAVTRLVGYQTREKIAQALEKNL